MKQRTKEELEELERIKAEDQRLQEEREKAYQEFFGQSWKDIIDLWMVEDLTPEEAVDRLGDEGLIDYCDNCKTYFLVDVKFGGVYHCPYCGHLGSNSEPDEWNDRLAYWEHEWETKNGR